ncbi:MAG TPA: hypothetical protein VLI54_00070 [Bacillota bacterium]|nr:hypothetical protein [Bacillota bacterium]
MSDILPTPGAPLDLPNVDDRCMTAIGRYMAHQDLGQDYGEVPLHVRTEWQELLDASPRLDTTSQYYWSWMMGELMAAYLTTNEDDASERRIIRSLDACMTGLYGVAETASASRIDRARARIAADSQLLQFNILTQAAPAKLKEDAAILCAKLVAPVKDALAWYQRTEDPAIWKYANVLGTLGVINDSFAAGRQGLFLATPSAARYEEAHGPDQSIPNDAPLWTWLVTHERHMPTRIAQRAPRGYAAVDPVFLSNESYKPPGRGPGPGIAHAVVDFNSPKPTIVLRTQNYLRDTGNDIRTVLVGSLQQDKTIMGFPEVMPEGAHEWYGAHPPHMPVTDIDTLRGHINTISGSLKETDPQTRMLLAGMRTEQAFAEYAAGDRRSAARRIGGAADLYARSVGEYQASGQLVRSFDAAFAHTALPMYAAVASGTDLIDAMRVYRRNLVELAESAIDWRGQSSVDAANREELDHLLQRITVTLLMSESQVVDTVPVINYAPLPSLDRQQGRFSEHGGRHWDISVLVAGTGPTQFSLGRMARFRLGPAADEASLDEAVFTVTPAMLQSRAGNHPLLASLMARAAEDPTAQPPALAKARKLLERGALVVNLL